MKIALWVFLFVAPATAFTFVSHGPLQHNTLRSAVADEVDQDVSEQENLLRSRQTEMNQRKLLEARLHLERRALQPSTDQSKIKAEAFSRSLLEARLAFEASDRRRKAELAIAAGEEKRMKEAARVEAENRAAAEKEARQNAARKATEQAEKARREEEARLAELKRVAAVAAEDRQRALLSARLEREYAVYAKKKESRDRAAAKETSILAARQQPKLPDEETKLSAKYGGMELGERAFQILLDLGMVESSTDKEELAVV